MASLGQIIYSSMIILIVVFSVTIILILALAFSGGNSSEVISSNHSPIANLGEDELLSCYINSVSGHNRFTEMSVTWEKTDLRGIVYQYEEGAPVLDNQNPQFRTRTQVFPDDVVQGNGSLLLRDVTNTDEGEYTCSISSSNDEGSVKIHLRTAAFSAPTFKFIDGVLAATAKRWFPKPNVTWLDHDGHVLKGSTNFTRNTAGIFKVSTALPQVNISDTYVCRIESKLVISHSKATITDAGVVARTYFVNRASSHLLASAHLSIVAAVLCTYNLT